MSDSTFINLHEQMQSKGWIPDWEFNEPVDLYKYNNCEKISECEGYKSDLDANGAWIYHLSSLSDGYAMFRQSTLESFSGDLSSLENGSYMFYNTDLASFNGDLSSLTNSSLMFYNSALESFNGDLSSLNNGFGMFYNTALTSFNGNLSSLTNGQSMFLNTPLESFSGDLSNLTNGNYMFLNTPLESFSGDLSNLTNGNSMFSKTALTSFNGDLTNLDNGSSMFRYTTLESFNGNLPSLTDGSAMFAHSALTSFNGDLTNLTRGHAMFYNSALESFNEDLSNLENGYCMFCYTHARTYDIYHYKIVDGVKKDVTTSVTSNGLKSFTSNLSSLTNGYKMFGESASNASPLNEESIMIIADTIQNIKGLGLTGENGQCQLWLGYDAATITDTTNINTYCDQISNKGWTVYLNGALQVANNGVIETIPLTDENGSPIVIPHYYKPLQVTNKDIAEYIDGNNNYYIIVGGQHVFGDDISTYGMFTSYEHAVNEISLGLGLIPYEKPDEVIIEE